MQVLHKQTRVPSRILNFDTKCVQKTAQSQIKQREPRLNVVHNQGVISFHMGGENLAPKLLKVELMIVAKKKYRKGMTPTEVLVNNLCDNEDAKEKIFREVDYYIEIRNEPHTKFNICLEVLKKHGLIMY